MTDAFLQETKSIIMLCRIMGHVTFANDVVYMKSMGLLSLQKTLKRKGSLYPPVTFANGIPAFCLRTVRDLFIICYFNIRMLGII